MRFVDKKNFNVNKIEQSDAFLKEKANLELFHSKDKLQQRYKFNQSIYLSFKPVLNEVFNYKCAFCESKVGAASPPVVEHFRPKLYYPWLAYSWENMYVSCSVCNRYKAAKFPVDGPKLEESNVVPIDDSDAQKFEKYLIIDPCNSHDILENKFEYNDNGEILATTERGKLTIDIYMLNRIELVKSRREHILNINTILDLFNVSSDFSIISQYVNDKTEYLSLYCYYIFKYYIKHRDKLSDSSANDLLDIMSLDIRYRGAEISKTNYDYIKDFTEKNKTITRKNINSKFVKSKIIKKIEINNFKSIKKVTLVLSGNDNNYERCLVLVGENGKGKSSILQAVSMALSPIDKIEELGLKPEHFIRKSQGVRQAVIKVFFDDSNEPSELIITKKEFIKNGSSDIIVLGYGATRLLPCRNERSIEFSGINSLFDQYHKLNDVVSWLSNPEKVSAKNFDFIVMSLRELLQINMDDDAVFRRRNGNVTLSSKRGLVNIFELSDGYKSVISYTLDIMLCVQNKFNAISDAEGVVLIDEIENHLHPTWKVKIISLLRSVFPKINFIITTHDPLCLRGTQEGEVYVLNEDENGDVMAESISVPRGIPIENLLLGSWFKMSSTLDEDTNSLFHEHRKLVHESLDNNAERIKEIEFELESLMKYNSNSGLFGDYLNTLKDVIKVKNTHNDLDSIRKGISERLSERFKK